VFPQGCEVKEATIYGPDYGLRYDAELWQKLDALEHSALLAHEAVYRVEKDFFNATHSITARKIVGRLFSSSGLDAAAWREIHPAVRLEILPESWVMGPLTGTDAYGTTNKNVTRAYYVRNSSTTPSSDIALAIEGVNAAQWKVTADTCRGQVLASRALCRVEVTFLAETPGTLAGSYSAVLRATGDAGAAAVYGLTGATTYSYRENWPDSNLGYPTYTGTVLPTSCPKKGDLFMLKVGDAPRGTQTRRIHLSEFDPQCPAGQWYMESGRGSAGSNAPGELRECGVTSGPTWRSNAGNGLCGPAGVDAAWASTSSALEGSCDVSSIYIVDFYYCE
jgi:hypothetical protein